MHQCTFGPFFGNAPMHQCTLKGVFCLLMHLCTFAPLEAQTMIAKQVPTRQIKLVWPEKLWMALSVQAKRQDTSLQTLITEAVLDKYGIEHWRKLGREAEIKKVEQILDLYRDTPDDIKSVVLYTLMKIKGEVTVTNVDDDLEIMLDE